MDQEFAYGYAGSGIVPLRRDPIDASEMCTQVLLGETFQIHEVKERWFGIQTDLDDYEGWVNRTECGTLSPGEYERWLENEERKPSWDYTYRAYSTEEEAILVPPGARLHFPDDKGAVKTPDGTFRPSREPVALSQQSPVQTALDFLGTPYLWGGRTDVGVDCSGLIQTIYLMNGVSIPADSWKQEAYFDRSVSTINDARRGDIIFFNPSKKRVSHVGFYLGDGRLLHASGKVRINNISKELSRDGESAEFNKRLANAIHSIYRSEIS